MCSSSSSGVDFGVSPSLNQRSCTRASCASPSSKAKCCDDSCIVKIARQDCNSEAAHQQHAGMDKPRDAAGGTSIPSRSDEEPCESHYLKAKAAYSGILENIGCICKVLLSLNLDSCCASQSGNSLRSKRSTGSMSKGLLAELDILSRAASSSKSEKDADCSGNSCCNDASSIDSGELAVPQATSSEIMKGGSCPSEKDADCSGNGCCNDASSIDSGELAAPQATSSEIMKGGSCPSALPRSEIELYSRVLVNTFDSNSKIAIGVKAIDAAVSSNSKETGCCDSGKTPINSCGSDNEQPVILPSSSEDCCAQVTCFNSSSNLGTKQKNTGSCGNSNESALADQQELGDPILAHIATGNPAETAADQKGTSYSRFTATGELDLEKGKFLSEHVVLSIQGMTCTGCEKKLYRSLELMPEISNIKTSLLLAQAEFDIDKSSPGVDTLNTINALEKSTGFICTKIAQSGHDLDLLVEANALEFTSRDLPIGVSDITIVDTHTIRVTYQPRLVGARDLLSDPFFESPKLAPIADRPLLASGRAHVRSMLLRTILSALLTIPVLVLAWAPLPENEVVYGAVSLVLATLIQLYIAGPFYIGAFNALFFSRMMEMDLLVVLSTTVAYIYSIIAYGYLVSKNPLSTDSFFETSTLLITLIMVGRLVSGFARQRAVEFISIESLQSSTAILTNIKTGLEQEIDARLLQYEDVFKVLPDSSIVTDGTVISGTSEVDESMVTGEATLVVKALGSPVVAGSINHSGTLLIRLTRLPSENTIKIIGSMVDEARSSKTKIQEIADRVASYFIPIILFITVLVFVIWIAIGKVIRGYDASTTTINAMTYAISALIVSCPCAIGLAVPMVLVVAGGVAAKHGLIFKTPQTIEIARNLSHVIFDKTGTLTQGLLTVETEEYPTGKGDMLAPILQALTSNSKHPISIAISSHLKSFGGQPELVEKVVSIAGSGIEATWKGMTIRAGNPHWLRVEDSPAVRDTLLLGISTFCVLINNELVAVFGLKDSLRPDAIRVINELKKRSVQVSIVSGDNRESVESVARTLGVPESHVRFRCSPADKQVYVKEMLAIPKSVVMFCGDGTNDAIALAQASIGMHMDGGTDIAQNAADAVLVRPDLGGIIVLMDLSKAFFRRVVFNFVWSFVYNAFAILLAAGAFPNARIPPKFAGLGEIVSVLPVLAISIHLRWAKF